jgi:Uma2 family endonuclease
MAAIPTRTRRWTRVEYDRLIDLGIFRSGEHLELLGGHLIVSEPQGTLHAAAVGLVEEALRICFGRGWTVRVQMPIALDDESEPEPDVAVVPGTHGDYAAAHPTCPPLLVEVAESSLADDRATKAALYARAGIADYWILNLVDRVLEVCRSPLTGALQPSGWRYRDITVLPPDSSIAPLARANSPIEVAALLPPSSGYYAR